MSASDVDKQLRRTSKRPDTLDFETFDNQGTVSDSTPGSRSRIASLQVDTVHKLRGGVHFALAIPAYESFTSDGTGGNTETFSLAHSVTKNPDVQDVVVYIGTDYYGEPDAVDYDNNTIDVTDPGSNNTVHVWYTSDEGATFELQKVVPGGGNTQTPYSAPLRFVHATDHAENENNMSPFETPLSPWLPGDYTLEVYVNAPYQVTYSVEGGAVTAPNFLCDLPVQIGQDTVNGLGALVRQDMSSQ